MSPPPSEPLYIVGTWHLLQYLHEQSDIYDLGLDPSSPNGVRCILSDALTASFVPRSSRPTNIQPWHDEHGSLERATELRTALGLDRLETVYVQHGCKCYGVVVGHQDGWSVVFSGDTLPTDALVEAGKGATVLVHEATMGDDQGVMARAKMHSTIGEAISVGARMDASHIVLTHFSARHPKAAPRSEKIHRGTITYALDHAHLRVGDLWKSARYLPAVKATLAAVADEDEEEEAAVKSMSW
jgi:ribonuclease Z